jgi:4-hydroxy-3-methylbut-2-enyl diphosphate reductase
VKALAKHVDVVLVVGSRNSSNSNRLREVALQHGVPAYLVDGVADIDDAWLDGKRRVGVTAGASAPEVLVREVVAHLQRLGAACVEDLDGASERVVFALPKDLPIVGGARTAAQPRE